MLGAQTVPVRQIPPAIEAINLKTTEITSLQVETDVDGSKISLNIIDTPGFETNIDNEPSIVAVMDYVERQYDEILAEESRIKRNPKFQDNRVHALVYFIQPTCQTLREIDIAFIKRLASRVNVIPVIAKSDSLTQTELAAFKKQIKMDISTHKLPIFDFPVDVEHDDEYTIKEHAQLRAAIPFAIICGSQDTGNGSNPRSRKYPWGTAEVDNSSHSEFQKLKAVLLSSHLKDLKEFTEVLYLLINRIFFMKSIALNVFRN